MREQSIRKLKKQFLLYLSLMLLCGCSKKEYEIIKYDDKTEYILDDNFIIDIWIDPDKVSGDNINILDDTDYINPYYKIYDSYLINDYKTMHEIIDVIYDYDNNDTPWNRHKITLYYEWLIHNIFYYENICVDRTKDVDFCNDENILELVKEKIF